MTRGELLIHLQQTVLKTPAVTAAFEKIDRADFVLPEYQGEAYEDYPLPIGAGGTISQPYTVAFMLELLQPEPGDKILDIGSGSGWTTALLAHLVSQKVITNDPAFAKASAGKQSPQGQVIGLEIVPELVEFGQKNLAKYNFQNAKIIQAKEGVVGLLNESPFDKILVSAAAEKIPNELVAQLVCPEPSRRATCSRLVIPIQNSIWLVEKDESGNITKTEFPGFVFVPLREP